MTIVGSPGAQYGRRQGPVQKERLRSPPGTGLQRNVQDCASRRFGIVYQPSALQASGTSGGSGDDGFDVNPTISQLQQPAIAAGGHAVQPRSGTRRFGQESFPDRLRHAHRPKPKLSLPSCLHQGIDIGNGVSTAYFDTYRNPYSIQWNSELSSPCPGESKQELGYLGNRGLFLVNGDPGLP